MKFQLITHEAIPSHAIDQHNLQATLAAIYSTLRAYPEALAAVQTVVTKLLGPCPPAPNGPN